MLSVVPRVKTISSGAAALMNRAVRARAARQRGGGRTGRLQDGVY